jgi:hypothetical protein
MLSELSLDYLTRDRVEWNADGFARLRLVGMNPRRGAAYPPGPTLAPSHWPAQARGEAKLRHLRLVPGSARNSALSWLRVKQRTRRSRSGNSRTRGGRSVTPTHMRHAEGLLG